jgi:Skp family chaperone for outer membrane proteins
MRKEGFYMKKKIITITAIMAVIASMAGCGKSNTSSNIVDTNTTSSSTASTATTDSTAAGSTEETTKTAEEVQKELDNFAADADKNVDMKKVGTEIKGESDGDNESKADLGGYEVEIKDGALAEDANGNKVLVVEFSFKNNTSQDINFSGAINVDAFQDKSPIPVAATFSAEGYDVLTQAQNVPYNETITVQKAFSVKDSGQVVIDVSKQSTLGGSQIISKTFNIQ